MAETISNNKRIAKNTIYLYLRMIIQLLVGLYMSRVLLHALGVSDYGIYNVVGGVVTMFSFFNGSMGTATNRFLAFELGNGEIIQTRMRKVFSTALLIHFIVALLFIVLCETVGLWYMNNLLVVPPERLNAALWVFQFSIITSVIAIISVPYNATIIAHEKMSAFAYISIIEVTIQLAIALFLDNTSSSDKLILYGLLLMTSQMVIRFIYGIYCKRHFKETSGKYLFDKKLGKQMSKFAFWILNGSVAVVGYTQGLNLLLNYFFGPVVNAARGIAVIVQTKMMGFCNNFQMAVNPQIIKSYAENDYKNMHQLVCFSSLFSFYLMLILSFPIILEADNILKIWLTEVPDYAPVFVRLTLWVAIIDSLRMPLNTSIHATGDIKKFQLIEGTTSLLILPAAFIALWCGLSPISVFWVQLIFFIIIQIERVFIVCPAIHMEKKTYMSKVVLMAAKVLCIAVIIPLLFRDFFYSGLFYVDMVMNLVVSFLSIAIVIYLIGMDKKMRETIKNKVLRKIVK